jgi:hypothetical protein
MLKIYKTRRAFTGDLVGRQFGRLTVQARVDAGHWRCVCVCGGVKDVAGSNLRSGNVASCGCLWNETRAANAKAAAEKRKGQKRPTVAKTGTAFRILLGTYRLSARTRGHVFELSDEVFRSITSAVCFYCGAVPARRSESYAGEVYLYNGIDRVNNALGYTADNSVSCCWKCNELKGSKNSKEFIAHIIKIAGHCAF